MHSLDLKQILHSISIISNNYTACIIYDVTKKMYNYAQYL